MIHFIFWTHTGKEFSGRSIRGGTGLEQKGNTGLPGAHPQEEQDGTHRYAGAYGNAGAYGYEEAYGYAGTKEQGQGSSGH